MNVFCSLFLVICISTILDNFQIPEGTTFMHVFLRTHHFIRPSRVHSRPSRCSTKKPVFQTCKISRCFFHFPLPVVFPLLHRSRRDHRAQVKITWSERLWLLTLVVCLFRFRKDPFREKGWKGEYVQCTERNVANERRDETGREALRGVSDALRDFDVSSQKVKSAKREIK